MLLLSLMALVNSRAFVFLYLPCKFCDAERDAARILGCRSYMPSTARHCVRIQGVLKSNAPLGKAQARRLSY